MSSSRACLLALTLLLASCDAAVTGHWCGKEVEDDDECNGDDLGFLMLNQDGSEVSGQACEAYEHDCYVIEDGKVDANVLTFRYTFKQGSVDAKLTASEQGDLVGSLFASKCECNVPFRFYRID